MSLARRLSAEGYSPERIHTEARVRFGREGGYVIRRIELRTEAEVPGVTEGLLSREGRGGQASVRGIQGSGGGGGDSR